MQLAFTLLHQLLVMSLVLFNSHSPSHDPPASAHLSASLRFVLELRGGLGSKTHGLLTGSGCLGISTCVSDPACMNARLQLFTCLDKDTCMWVPWSI